MQLLTGLHTCDECGKESVIGIDFRHESYDAMTTEHHRVCSVCLEAAVDALKEAEECQQE